MVFFLGFLRWVFKKQTSSDSLGKRPYETPRSGAVGGVGEISGGELVRKV